MKRLNKLKDKLVIEPERKLKGPFFGSELAEAIELADELAKSSDSFLNPLLGEFIS
tara:strand:+ start:150 stop:317 length:168 start_codon:yes stop_codon:yes gene_type:complete